MSDTHSTSELVERARRGDRAAFDRLFGGVRDRLAGIARKRAGAGVLEQVDIDDVLQETMLRAFRSLERFEWRGEESFLRWLGGIAGHVILKVAERPPRREILKLPGDPAASGVSPSRGVRRLERFDRLERALEGLKEDYRDVVVLARIEGLPLGEVARRMGRTESAVKNLLLRALRELRHGFGDTESLGLPDRSLAPTSEESRDGE